MGSWSVMVRETLYLTWAENVDICFIPMEVTGETSSMIGPLPPRPPSLNRTRVSDVVSSSQKSRK